MKISLAKWSSLNCIVLSSKKKGQLLRGSGVNGCSTMYRKKGIAGSFIKKANSEIAAPKRFFRRMQEAPAFVSREF